MIICKETNRKQKNAILCFSISSLLPRFQEGKHTYIFWCGVLQTLICIDQQSTRAALLRTTCTTCTTAISSTTAVVVPRRAVLARIRAHVSTTCTTSSAQQGSTLHLPIRVVKVVGGVVILLGFDELGVIVGEHLHVVAVLAALALATGGGGDWWRGQVQEVLFLRGDVRGGRALA
jgi:hypothetical protein